MGARRAWPASGGPGRCGTARDRIGALEVLARHGSHGVSAAEPAGRQLVVVTSDQEVVRDVRRAGARTVPADALVALVARAS